MGWIGCGAEFERAGFAVLFDEQRRLDAGDRDRVVAADARAEPCEAARFCRPGTSRSRIRRTIRFVLAHYAFLGKARYKRGAAPQGTNVDDWERTRTVIMVHVCHRGGHIGRREHTTRLAEGGFGRSGFFRKVSRPRR